MFQAEGRHVARTVPSGAVVEIAEGPLDGNKLVEVIWDRHRVMMFTQDLRARAEPLE